MEMQAKQEEIRMKAQKLQLDAQKNELEKAKLMVEVQKIQDEKQMNIYDHQLDLEKARAVHGMDHRKHESDFTIEIAKMLTDLHKHHNPQPKSSE
jgi:hypothetical protein